MSTDLTCLRCGSGGLAEGYMGHSHDAGYDRWVQGRLELNIVGAAKSSGRRALPVVAYRCRQCNHLELFAGDDGW